MTVYIYLYGIKLKIIYCYRSFHSIHAETSEQSVAGYAIGLFFACVSFTEPFLIIHFSKELANRLFEHYSKTL
jgi:hypothetical protein